MLYGLRYRGEGYTGYVIEVRVIVVTLYGLGLWWLKL